MCFNTTYFEVVSHFTGILFLLALQSLVLSLCFLGYSSLPRKRSFGLSYTEFFRRKEHVMKR